MPNRLVDDSALDRSPVVANATMNRGRGLCGVNSYERELRLNPLDVLLSLLRDGREAAWLDLCCGRGRALIEAGLRLRDSGLAEQAVLVGVDLVPMFDPVPVNLRCVRLEAVSLRQWSAPRTFDLVTCVHGLHYVGDKLDLLRRVTGWLAPGGLFAANLHLANVNVLRKTSGGTKPVRGWAARALGAAGFNYDGRRRLVRRTGGATVAPFPCHYLGADDAAGPNYTHQPVVTSCYIVND